MQYKQQWYWNKILPMARHNVDFMSPRVDNVLIKLTTLKNYF